MYLRSRIKLCLHLVAEGVGAIFDTWRLRQNGHTFADDAFKLIFVIGDVYILIQIPLKFVAMGPINNMPTMVQIMAWCRSGDKPLSEPMMASLLLFFTHYASTGLNQFNKHQHSFIHTTCKYLAHMWKELRGDSLALTIRKLQGTQKWPQVMFFNKLLELTFLLLSGDTRLRLPTLPPCLSHFTLELPRNLSLFHGTKYFRVLTRNITRCRVSGTVEQSSEIWKILRDFAALWELRVRGRVGGGWADEML